MAGITLSDVNGDPKRTNDAAPNVDPPTCLEDSADQEELEPTLESGGGDQDSSNGRDEKVSGEGIFIGCEVWWEVV